MQKVTFRCEHCNSKLLATFEDSVWYVEPCHSCLVEAYEEGHRDGENYEP